LRQRLRRLLFLVLLPVLPRVGLLALRVAPRRVRRVGRRERVILGHFRLFRLGLLRFRGRLLFLREFREDEARQLQVVAGVGEERAGVGGAALARQARLVLLRRPLQQVGVGGPLVL